MKENIIQKKSFDFAVQIIETYKYLAYDRKETNETLYWLNLLQTTHYLHLEVATKLIETCEELLKMLTSIIKTMERKTK